MLLKLGCKAKDNITGFVGIIIGKVEYLNGCKQCELQAIELKDGLPQKPIWIDEGQLDEVKSKDKKEPVLGKTAAQGGPQDTSGMGLHTPD